MQILKKIYRKVQKMYHTSSSRRYIKFLRKKALYKNIDDFLDAAGIS